MLVPTLTSALNGTSEMAAVGALAPDGIRMFTRLVAAACRASIFVPEFSASDIENELSSTIATS